MPVLVVAGSCAAYCERAAGDPAAGLPSLPEAGGAGLTLRLRLLAEGSAITAGEPLVAEVELTNAGGEARRLVLGPDASCGVCFVVLDAGGRVLTPSAGAVEVGRANRVRALEAGESIREFYVVAWWYPFNVPGRYTVRAELLHRTTAVVRVVGHDEVGLDVKPADPVRLERRCQELLELVPGAVTGGRPPGGPRGVPALAALQMVRHNVVLPYLDFLARRFPSSARPICHGIRAVGTKRAEDLLTALGQRGDAVGEAAREALRAPPEGPSPQRPER